MNQWKACELHTHTLHSDGDFSVEKLASCAKEFGLDCIALTDHNTISGHLEIPEVSEKIGIDIIRGLEWTTFYGHVVALGITKYIDWHNIGKYNLNKGVQEIHENGALAGIAHPFRLGNPISTGTYFEYEVSDWNDIDYLEVWSEEFPSMKTACKRAFELWDDLLNKGYRITGVSGRDWHRKSTKCLPISKTYIKVDNNLGIEEAIKDSIKKGSVICSYGPLITLSAYSNLNEDIKEVGEELLIGSNTVHKIDVNIDFNNHSDQWNLKEQELIIQLNSNLGILNSIEKKIDQERLSFEIDLKSVKWIRVQVVGEILGENSIVGFTNPIYINESN